MMRRAWENRPLRRLALVVIWLAAFDQFVDPFLASRERERYERGGAFRFENSDLFGLGPLVQYFHEYPRGERPRTVFFGNSIVWGYGLQARMAVPAQMQALEPQTRVFNIAVNGFETGNSLLIARTIIDSVDRLFVLRSSDRVHPQLSSLIPIADDDIREFNLPRRDATEQALERRMRWWRLYDAAYRLQMATFGTSTRQYIYLHKGELARGLMARLRAQEPISEAPDGVIGITRPLSVEAVPEPVEQALAEQHRLVWRFGALARDHRKRVVLLHIPGYSKTMADEEIAAFNRVFAPHAEILMLRIPRALTYDGQHLTETGSHALAVALWRHEREIAGARP